MALSQAGLSLPGDIDAIAVTLGPGMTASLANGLVAAKTLAAAHGKPLVYVHHMVAHALTPLFAASLPEGGASSAAAERADPRPTFPFLTFLVSGGHTLLVLSLSPRSFRILATTHDNAIGDAFDKAARALRLSWGPTTPHRNPGSALEACARRADPALVREMLQEDGVNAPNQLPVAMRGQAGFSYSGLITMIERVAAAQANLHNGAEASGEAAPRTAALAHLFQEAAFGQLTDKLRMLFTASKSGRSKLLAASGSLPAAPGPSQRNVKAVAAAAAAAGASTSTEIDALLPQVRHIVVSGGVASNGALRTALRASLDRLGRSEVQLLFPPLTYCTDNAAMIANCGLVHWDSRTEDLSPQPKPKWSIGEMHNLT